LGGVVGASVSLGQNFHSEVRLPHAFAAQYLNNMSLLVRRTEVRSVYCLHAVMTVSQSSAPVSNGTYVRISSQRLQELLIVLR
jgi:hypothetical protein